MEGNIVPTEPGQYVPRLALVNYADAASTLPLPTPIAPSTGPISPALADEQTVVALDASLSRDPALVNALVQRLQTTEISFMCVRRCLSYAGPVHAHGFIIHSTHACILTTVGLLYNAALHWRTQCHQ